MARFDKKWFNPLYFIILNILKDESVRQVLIYGGKSSSKTVSVCQALAKEAYVKSANSITFRKESAIIPTTLKKSFNLAIDSMYLFPAVDKQDRRFLFNSEPGKQSEIVMKGLDDPEKAKGIESYKYVLLDELNHFDEAEYEQFNLLLRGIPGQKLFGLWNPVDERSWVKTELVDKYVFYDTEEYGTLPSAHSFIQKSECGKVILIRTTYHDNYWIVGSPCGSYGYRDENLISEYESLANKNYNSYKVNVIGEWGKTDYGGEYLDSWRSELHTGIYPYDPEQAIYLSLDENVVPYFPAGFFQPGRDNKSPRMIHVIGAKSPENKTWALGRKIKKKLVEWNHVGRLYVVGDSTSQKEDVKQEKGVDLFVLVMKEFPEFKPKRIVPASNPNVQASGDFLNAVLEHNFGGLSFGVDHSCQLAINDYENTKQDKNGKIDKKTVKDPRTGQTYQPFGHIVDITRYFFCTVFSKEYAEFQRSNLVTGGHRIGKPSSSNNSY